MKEKVRKDLIQFLRKSIDVFAWSHDDMPGIDPSVITHRLNVYPFSKPVRQKKRVFAPERDKAIKEEVQKLTTAQFIKEVYYPDWLANVMMVKKENGKWRMCIGRNIEVYVDNMLVKSLDEGSHLDDLQETFETLRRYKMKLNPSECAFGVSSEKFLGFMVSQRGIEANLDKIQAILDMEPLKNIKEVQSLTGRVTALNSSALIREEGKVQKPVNNTSRALKGAEGRYPLIEKLAFALITASRKLRHYFQVHVISVMTNHPLRKAMNKLKAARRLIQWAVELSEFDIRYQPRNAIKTQALVDFIAEFTPSYEDLGGREDNKKWVVHVDGSSTLHVGGIGVVLQSLEGDKLKHKVRLQYQTTNIEVEYEAFLKGLELAKFVEADSILVSGDSQLVIGQVNGTCEAKEDRMKRYLKKVVRLVKKFKEADFIQIPREENVEADTLAKEASVNEAMDELDEVQYMPSINLPEMLQIEGDENWMTPIVSYLKDGRLLEEKDEARKLRVKSARTTVRTLTGETPFKLAYGSKVVIPAEVHMASHRVRKYQAEENEEQLCLNLDLMDEVRMDAE
ncbi:uncharacterized protein LOC115984983 [Quercus lobata]|uniref:uncharacterized protein LOC115984983 n=1 Tax=Quercus lobata TaxID=97700 RepID=UPI001245A56E|nr:uncharacterized protein LOC115984983 [Quercus lobata]